LENARAINKGMRNNEYILLRHSGILIMYICYNLGENSEGKRGKKKDGWGGNTKMKKEEEVGVCVLLRSQKDQAFSLGVS